MGGIIQSSFSALCEWLWMVCGKTLNICFWAMISLGAFESLLGNVYAATQ